MRKVVLVLLFSAATGTPAASEFDPTFCYTALEMNLASTKNADLKNVLCMMRMGADLAVKAKDQNGINVCSNAVNVLTAEFKRRFPGVEPSTACN